MAKYCLSLTGAGTYQTETVAVARAFLERRDWVEVRKLIVDENLLLLNTDGNRKRIGGEILKRLKTLNNQEIELYANAVGDDLAAITWISLCRTYPLVKSFAQEVLVKRYARMIPDLPHTTYDAFADDQRFEHPEFAALTQKSQDKVEIRVFGFLRDCHLIDRSYHITPLYVSPRFVEIVSQEHEEDLALFPKVGVLL